MLGSLLKGWKLLQKYTKTSCHMYEIGLKLLKAFPSYAETMNTNFYIIL